MKVWRYLDLAKLLDLLERQTLYFGRLDLLGDPFEGSRPLPNVEANWQLVRKLHAEDPAFPLEIPSRIIRNMRRRLYASCWHQNEVESAAMWQLYGAQGSNVALQTTYRRLRESLPEQVDAGWPVQATVFVGMVTYIDYRTTEVEKSGFAYAMHKRMSFSHEREIRALANIHVPELDESTSPEGLHVPWRFSDCVEAIYVSPDAPRWFAGVVERIMKRYGLDLQVHHSSLLEDPLF